MGMLDGTEVGSIDDLVLGPCDGDALGLAEDSGMHFEQVTGQKILIWAFEHSR